MNRRPFLSLTLLAALPLSLDPVRPVRVDRNGNLLDPGSFPKAGVADLQLHLDWLHDNSEYFLHIDFPIEYVGEPPEEESRIIPVDHGLHYRVPVVSGYRVVDPGYVPEVPERRHWTEEFGLIVLPAIPARPYLDDPNLEDLHATLEIAKADPDFRLFSNYPIRCTDPHLQARIYIFDGASSEEIDDIRSAWDEWSCGPTEHRIYA
jgi:hypothetical protein